MKLTAKIRRIDYGDLVEMALPMIRELFKTENEAIRLTIDTIPSLPPELIRSLLEAVPEERRNEIVAAYAAQYSREILVLLNKISEQQQLGLCLTEVSLDRQLQLCAAVGRIDYLHLVSKFLNQIKQKLLALGGPVMLMGPVIRGASAETVCSLMDRFLGGSKDRFLASMVNQNAQQIIRLIEEEAAKEGVRLELEYIYLEA